MPEPLITSGTSAEANPWPQIARQAALVAGLFCALVTALLIANRFQSQTSDPLNSRELAAMKARLVNQSQEEALKQRIRAVDLDLRRRHARHLALASQGSWLLLGGVTVFLTAIKLGTYRKRLPRPAKKSATDSMTDRQAGLAWWAVAATGGITLGLALLAVRMSSTHIPAPPASALAVAAKTDTPSPTGGPGSGAIVHPTDTPLSPIPTPEEIQKNWPRFRGPGGLGVSSYTNVPITWNAATGENVLWKTVVPISGPNSPILWGNRLFLAGANKSKREIYCFDAATGKLVWQKPVEAKGADPEPPNVMEDSGGYAPATAATDGRRVYAIFVTGDVAAFDLEGKPVWAKNLGKPDNSYGHATSLEVYQNRLLIQLDQGTGKDGKSRLLCLDSQTGEIAWQSQPRPVPNSWSTPIVIQAGPREQIITCAKPWVIAYDPANGSEIWRAEVLYGEVTPSPIFSAGLVFTVMEGEKLSAIRPDGTGDVTKTHVVWSGEDGLPDICSPLSDGQRIYLLTTGGTVTCYEIATGKKLWEKETELSCHSSPSLAGDRIYIVSDKGPGLVIQAGPEFKEIARTELGEEVLSTPAFADGRIYIRAKQHLFCLGVKAK